MANDDRITRLEEQIAHQLNTIDELSDQVAEQWRTIEMLRKTMDGLTERFLAVEEQAREPIPVTRPPHY